MKTSEISRHKTMIAFLTGMLFVTHPLATQSVTYIAQRFASLATLFYLLSLILFIQGKLWQGNRNIPKLLFGGSLVSAVLGMLTKEIVFTLPFAILLYDYCFLTQFRVILTYIRLFILPINQNLDYDYQISTGFFQLKTFLSFSILLGILAAGVLLFKKYRLISFGIFWFFLTMSVESSIIPISRNVIFEHRTKSQRNLFLIQHHL